MNADPLANLADIHIPDPVPSWPPAIGWWLLLALVVIAVIACVMFFINRYKKQAYRREALARLNEIKQQADSQSNPTEVAMALSGLLKQVAITRFGRHQTASLAGNDWLMFLDEKGKTDAFSKGPGRILGDDIYKPDVVIDLDSLFNLSQQWIEKQS